MKRQTIGLLLMPLAYMLAGVILIVGFSYLAIKTGIGLLTDAAIESLIDRDSL